MSLRKLVNLIFLEGFEPEEIAHPTNLEYIELLENCKQLENKLREQLTSEQETFFEECLTEFLIKAGCEQKEYFLMGMATGMRMIIESMFILALLMRIHFSKNNIPLKFSFSIRQLEI